MSTTSAVCGKSRFAAEFGRLSNLASGYGALSVLVIVLGLWQTWISRFAMNADGVQYLDFANQFSRGFHWTLVNGYWSPLYPLVLAFALGLCRPSPANQVVVIHFLNFTIYLLAWAAFCSFWRTLRRELPASLDEVSFRVSGASVFLISALVCTNVEYVTPDLLVFAISLYVIRTLLVASHSARSPDFVWLGVLLSIGYFAKAFLFPLAFVILAGGAIGTRRLSAGTRCLVAGVLSLLAVSSLWIVPLSMARGKLTIGDSGGLNYAIWVNHVLRQHPAGPQLPPGTRLDHPTSQIALSPPAFAFAEPFHTTYASVYDESYFLSGLRPTFRLDQQLRALWLNVKILGYAVLHRFLWIIPAPSLFLLVIARIRRRGMPARALWTFAALLSVIAAAALSMFLLINVELRYLALPVGLFNSVLLAIALAYPEDRLQRVVVLSCFVGCILAVATMNLETHRRSAHRNIYWETALAAQRAGIRPGENTANIGKSVRCYWQHLMGVRIVAEVPEGNGLSSPDRQFWNSSTEVQKRALAALRSAGAQHITATPVPPNAGAEWLRIGADYAIYIGD